MRIKSSFKVKRLMVFFVDKYIGVDFNLIVFDLERV